MGHVSMTGIGYIKNILPYSVVDGYVGCLSTLMYAFRDSLP